MSNLAVQRQAVNHNKAAAQMTNNISSLNHHFHPQGDRLELENNFNFQ